MEVFGDTFIPARSNRRAGRRCPRCTWTYLRPVRGDEEAHLLCESCGHCWQLERDRLRAVNVLACHGYAARAKRDCITLLHDEFPRFGGPLAESLT